MWVFGYGSLMWDGWEREHACVRQVPATLPGFVRAFNKGSVRNWGTRTSPGPTLNIVDNPAGQCAGVAFEFAETDRQRVLSALEAREGKNFRLAEHEIVLSDGNRVTALVPRYMGKNVIPDKPLAERVKMIRAAAGTNGRCEDYVTGIAAKLKEMGIADPAVEELSGALQAASERGPERSSCSISSPRSPEETGLR